MKFRKGIFGITTGTPLPAIVLCPGRCLFRTTRKRKGMWQPRSKPERRLTSLFCVCATLRRYKAAFQLSGGGRSGPLNIIGGEILLNKILNFKLALPVRTSTITIAKMLKYHKKGCPKKILNFKLAFNYACLHDRSATSKNFPCS